LTPPDMNHCTESNKLTPPQTTNQFCTARNEFFKFLQTFYIQILIYLIIRPCYYVCFFDVRRHAAEQLVEVLRYKPEGRGSDSRWFYLNFSLT